MRRKKQKADNSWRPTTGSLATATALSALKTITEREEIEIVQIITPNKKLDIIIKENKLISENKAESIAIKYPYNDPDMTVNLEIIATVELKNNTEIANDSNNNNNDNNNNNNTDTDTDTDTDTHTNIIIHGGEGVGILTKEGLQIPVGKPAINPIPQKMIKDNLKKYVPKDKIAIVTISVPKGKEIAKKTMNPRLGIVNGISILGTTGIARSMSTKAYKDSIVYQIDVAIASKFNEYIFVPGNIGEKIAIDKLAIDKEQIIQTGNYPGFMFEEAKKRGINKLTLIGHIGKLVKLAGGIFNTKHSIADGRLEIIAANAALVGAKQEIIQELFASKTTEDMVEILKKEDLDKVVLNNIALAIKNKCLDRFEIEMNVILVDMKGNYLNDNFTKELLK